jgi:hypothetical protein
MTHLLKSFWDTGMRWWNRRWVRRLVSGLVTLLVLAFLTLYASQSMHELQQIWQNLRLPILLLTFPMFLLLTYAAGYMWSKIIRLFYPDFQDGLNIYIYLLTLAARRLPGSLLHIVGRTALYKKKGASVKMLAFTSTLEIALILWSGILVSLAAWLLFYRINISQMWVLLIAFILITLLIHPKTLRYLLKRLTKDENPPPIPYGSMLKLLIGYVLIWLIGGTMLFVIIAALYPVGAALWFQALIAWSFSGVSGMLITFLPSGLGIVEIAMSLILGQFIPSSVAVSVAILSRILFTFYDFAVSLALFGFEKHNNPYGLL